MAWPPYAHRRLCEERSDVFPDQWWELARLANALAIAARAISKYTEPLRALHRDDAKAAEEWENQRWRHRVHHEGTRQVAAQLALETLGWRGVPQHLAADEELAAGFENLITRFRTLRAPGQDADEGGRDQGAPLSSTRRCRPAR
jgi:hypothetical protein